MKRQRPIWRRITFSMAACLMLAMAGAQAGLAILNVLPGPDAPATNRQA